MSNLIKIVLLIALVVLLIVVGPVLTIWALNVLFPVLAIPYTIWSWLAVIILGSFLRANVTLNK